MDPTERCPRCEQARPLLEVGKCSSCGRAVNPLRCCHEPYCPPARGELEPHENTNAIRKMLAVEGPSNGVVHSLDEIQTLHHAHQDAVARELIREAHERDHWDADVENEIIDALFETFKGRRRTPGDRPWDAPRRFLARSTGPADV